MFYHITKKELLDEVENISFLKNYKIVNQFDYPRDDLELVLEFIYNSEAYWIGFNRNFLVEPPFYYRKGDNEYICYYQRESFYIIEKNPVKVIKKTWELACERLIRELSGDIFSTVLNEFEGYWGKKDKCEIARSIINPKGKSRKIKIASFKEVKFIGDDEESLNNLIRNLFQKKDSSGISFTNSFLIRLDEQAQFDPRNDYSLDYFYNFVSKYKGMERDKKKDKQLEKVLKSNHSLYFSLPLPNGNIALWGIKQNSPDTYIPLCLDRWDQGHLIPRGGGIEKLKLKNVIVIGCGSVGGFIIKNLTNSGIGNLHLIDYDILTIENIYRHVLGMNFISQFKVNAMKIFLDISFPDITITPHSEDIIDLIKNNKIKIEKSDLVIAAIDNNGTNLCLNELFHSKSNYPPIIFTWVDPYGIGGHALLSNNSDKSGCLKCLMANVNGFWHKRSSFVKPGKYYMKSASGCGSLYLPYGSIDASQTANLASNLAIDVLLGREKGNPLISWKGKSDDLFSNEGEVSKRFEMSVEDLYKTRYDYIVTDCNVCGEK